MGAEPPGAVHTEQHQRAPRSAGALVLLGLALVAAMGSVAIDLYIPSMPRIGAELGASDPLVQTTMTAALIGFAVGQVVFGPVTDRFGRRRPLLIANVALVVSAVVCAVAPSIGVLTGSRLLQGLACSAGTVVASATVRDLYEGRAFIRAIGHVLAVTAAVPILAPSLGGFLMTVVSWRSLFLVIAGASATATLVYVLWVPETAPLPSASAARRSPLLLLESYRRVLRDRRFVMLTLLMTLVWGGATWTYVTASTFVFQRAFGLTEVEFGAAFGVNAFCGWLGVQIGSRLSVRLSSLSVVTLCTYTGLVCTLLMWSLVVAGAGGLPVVAAGVALLYLSAGTMTPHVSQLSLQHLGSDAGSASALPGATTLVLAAVIGPVTAALGTDSAVPMTSVMLLAMVGAAIVCRVGLARTGRDRGPDGPYC